MGCNICKRERKDVGTLYKTPKGNKICDHCIDTVIGHVNANELKWDNERLLKGDK